MSLIGIEIYNYSLTVDTAYGDYSARIVEKKELDEFLKDW
jgi:hypothetical protein